jgi:hypothetical protein
MRTKVIVNHANETRTSCWTLIQDDDRSLHVHQSATYAGGRRHERTVPINDFLRENGPPPEALQTLIDRMFEGAEKP